jgi:hypothetical protein
VSPATKHVSDQFLRLQRDLARRRRRRDHKHFQRWIAELSQLPQRLRGVALLALGDLLLQLVHETRALQLRERIDNRPDRAKRDPGGHKK